MVAHCAGRHRGAFAVGRFAPQLLNVAAWPYILLGCGYASLAIALLIVGAQRMKSRKPGPDEARIETPQWALDRAGEVAREMVANISASGVHIVGDLGRLTEVPTSKLAGDRLPEVQVPPAIAASMSIGILIAGGFARDASKGANVASLSRVPSKRVAKVLYRRLRGAARVRYWSTRRRIQSSLARR